VLSVPSKKTANDITLNNKKSLKAYGILRSVLIENLARFDDLLRENLRRMNRISEGGEKERRAEVKREGKYLIKDIFRWLRGFFQGGAHSDDSVQLVNNRLDGWGYRCVLGAYRFAMVADSIFY
jgi:hypothetical protein